MTSVTLHNNIISIMISITLHYSIISITSYNSISLHYGLGYFSNKIPAMFML